MKTVFDETTRTELVNRINALTKDSRALWGKMDVSQMLEHCTLWEEMVLGNKRYMRVLIGLLLGRMLLKNELRDERPMRKNNPTIPELKITTQIPKDSQDAKTKWITFIHEYSRYSLPDNTFIHPFFGRMTRAQIGMHSYKHTDHHLRQFGC